MKSLNATIKRMDSSALVFYPMKIKKNELTYLVSFKQKANVQITPVVGVSCCEEIKAFIHKIFSGRFRKPNALSPLDGVAIIVRRIGNEKNESKIIMNTRIYNKSVRQARIDFEKALRNS